MVFYLTITKTPFEYESIDMTKLDELAPYGKLPYIIDDDGTKVADSNQIIEYLEEKHGISLDKDLSPADKAVCLAFDRLCCEHLYWSGGVEPRWRQDAGWEAYIPYLVGGAEVNDEVRALLEGFRVRIMAQFDGSGMGRRPSTYVAKLFRTDIDAIANYMGNKKYFFDDQVRGIDATVYAWLRHCNDQAIEWEGTGYVQSKKNLAEYLERMREEFNI